MSSTSKSFLIKDILSETSPSISSDDESEESKDIFVEHPIDLRRYFKHPLCPIPIRPTSFFRTKSSTNYRDKDSVNSPLNALFEMTKKTFDQTDLRKFCRIFLFTFSYRTDFHSNPIDYRIPL